MSKADRACFAFAVSCSVATGADAADLMHDAIRLLRCAEGVLKALEPDSDALDAVAQLLAQACGLIDAAIELHEGGSALLAKPLEVYRLRAGYMANAGCTVGQLCMDGHALALSAVGVLSACVEFTEDAEFAVLHLLTQGAVLLGEVVAAHQLSEADGPPPAPGQAAAAVGQVAGVIPANVQDFWDRAGRAAARSPRKRSK